MFGLQLGRLGSPAQSPSSDDPETPPEGFVFLLGADGAYLLGADGAYLLGAS